PISLILIDIDYFKLYNDTLGHRQGDECLRQVAAALKQGLHCVPDFVAHYGGEEFVVVLPHTGREGAVQVAERLRTWIEALDIAHPASSVSDRVAVSLGVASTLPSGKSMPDDLIQAADHALYAAKIGGRNQVQVAPE
ncbi:MAG TPA: diguanylate cyclase, partial [Dehalococcoidia bacterium]|nr:diguanylate cyclase [Dehalococcoidia bacterium]